MERDKRSPVNLIPQAASSLITTLHNNVFTTATPPPPAKTLAEYLKEGAAQINMFAVAHKNLDSVPGLVEKKNLATQTVWVESFLIWLENSLVMTPGLKAPTHIDQALEPMARPNTAIPRPIAPPRRAFWHKFESESWVELLPRLEQLFHVLTCHTIKSDTISDNILQTATVRKACKVERCKVQGTEGL